MDAREDAETVGLRALAWLAAEEGLLDVFLGASGLAAEDLRHRAGEVEVLAAVLDFLLMDDRWVLDFAAEAGLPPEAVAQARAALPGGALPHWT